MEACISPNSLRRRWLRLQPGAAAIRFRVLKAGIMEIADIFVVNKADHPMADQLRRELRSMMQMRQWPGWVPELVVTQAVDGRGIDELVGAIERHIADPYETGEIEAPAARCLHASSAPVRAGTDCRASDSVLQLASAHGTRPVRSLRTRSFRAATCVGKSFGEFPMLASKVRPPWHSRLKVARTRVG